MLYGINIFPYRPDEAAVLGCESLSTTKLFHCSVFREVTYTYFIKLFSSKLLTLIVIYGIFFISVFSKKYHFTLCFSLKKGRSVMASFLILLL